MSSSFSAAKGLREVTSLAAQLSAIELLVGAQCVDLRKLGSALAPKMQACVEKVRTLSPFVTEDRPLSSDIERLSEAVHAGDFAGYHKEPTE